ncbi:MAG: DUF4080 domain-containing protein [Deltaproteobacteria bacterium]|jgi:radical SAM superfamily enzyme YgiQ (UPF0313 family)|nr:DUF4080 domain-containing protein [Deltaproteobacteria bacterium]
MSDILLIAFNARFFHPALNLRYLKANLGENKDRCTIKEYNLDQKLSEVLEEIIAAQPLIIGIGVYIWNRRLVLSLLKNINALRPEINIVLGGPEAGYEYEGTELLENCDYLIIDEGEISFSNLCSSIMAGNSPTSKIIKSQKPDLDNIELPYYLYSEEDIEKRFIYVESSRGCPFSCEFCLSSLDKGVRQFNRDKFIKNLGKLYDRGCRTFKFLDRDIALAQAYEVLDFFLARDDQELFLHFELVPGIIPARLKSVLASFKHTTIQIEAGIQSFNEKVNKRLKRYNKNDSILEDLEFLNSLPMIHLHADLIVGLPGEDIASFAQGFDLLYNSGVEEIQVGILKKLRGTAIGRHDQEYTMVFNQEPPYEILENSDILFLEMQTLKRFARFWKIVSNSGNFKNSVKLIWENHSVFYQFYDFSNWLYQKTNATHAFSLNRMATFIHEYLVEIKKLDEYSVKQTIESDYKRLARNTRPQFLSGNIHKNKTKKTNLMHRQKKHRVS